MTGLTTTQPLPSNVSEQASAPRPRHDGAVKKSLLSLCLLSLASAAGPGAPALRGPKRSLRDATDQQRTRNAAQWPDLANRTTSGNASTGLAFFDTPQALREAIRSIL